MLTCHQLPAKKQIQEDKYLSLGIFEKKIVVQLPAKQKERQRVIQVPAKKKVEEDRYLFFDLDLTFKSSAEEESHTAQNYKKERDKARKKTCIYTNLELSAEDMSRRSQDQFSPKKNVSILSTFLGTF